MFVPTTHFKCEILAVNQSQSQIHTLKLFYSDKHVVTQILLRIIESKFEGGGSDFDRHFRQKQTPMFL